MTAILEEPLTEHEALMLANFTPGQIRQARKCVAEGGIKPTAHRGEFYVTSSDGKHAYLTAVDACGCRAGDLRRICWHRAAVILYALAGAE